MRFHVGGEYDVSWDDCCAAGRFTSAIESIKFYPDGDGTEDSVEEVVFANGVTLTCPLYGVTFNARPIGTSSSSDTATEE